MGFTSYQDSKQEGDGITLESRTCVTVRESSNKLIKRTSTIKKERVSGPKELQQRANNDNSGNNHVKEHTTITKSRSIDKTLNKNVFTHKNCDRETRINAHNSSKADNECQRKLKDATHRLLELEHAIDNDIKILKQKQLSILKRVAKSKIKLQGDVQKSSTCAESQAIKQENRKDKKIEQYSKEHKYAEDKNVPLKPKTRTVGSQMSNIFDENRFHCGAFGDNISKYEDFFTAVGRDGTPNFVKDFFTTPIVTADYEHVVNICCSCSKPFRQYISPGEYRMLVCGAQRNIREFESPPRPECSHEEYYYLNPHKFQSHTQNCNCSQGHCYNCCQCKEKQLEKPKSYKRRTTDLNTQHFYYRKSESHVSSKSTSPDKSKSVKHQTNFKLIRNEENNTKSKEDYEQSQGSNRKQKQRIKAKRDEEHVKERKKSKNYGEKSSPEVLASFHKILIETLGEERVCKLINVLDNCTEETDKILNRHKKEGEKQPIMPVLEPGTFKVGSKESNYKISFSKQNTATNSSRSPRGDSPDSYIDDPSHEPQYSLETLSMLRKMKIKEYKAIRPTANGKFNGGTKQQKEEFEEKNINHRSQDKAMRYHEYIKRYKNHDQQRYDEPINTENEIHHTYDVIDTFEEKLYAYGPASSGWDDYRKETDVYKEKERSMSNYDFTGLRTDEIENSKHTKKFEHNSDKTRRIQDLIGNEKKSSYTSSKERISIVYKDNISNTEPKHRDYKTETQIYLNGSTKGAVKHKTGKPQNTQVARNSEDNKFNVSGKNRLNSTDDVESHNESGKSIYDLKLSMIAPDLYENPRNMKDYNRNQEDLNKQHINNDYYYKNLTESESGSEGPFRENIRSDTQVNNIETETSQYSAFGRIQDVTEEIKSGRSYIISSESRDVKNECKGIDNKLERNYKDSTSPKDFLKLQNISEDNFTEAHFRNAINVNKEDTLSKPQSSFKELKTCVNYQLTDDMQNKNLLKIEESTGKCTSNEEPLPTSHSIRLKNHKEAMNQLFEFDKEECAISCTNLSDNKLTKDNDFSIESIKLKDSEGINGLENYASNFKRSNCNSSLDTLRCLGDMLNLYQKGTLEDENLRVLAEELLTNLSTNCRDNCPSPEDKSTFTRQEVLCPDQEMFESFGTIDLVKAAESSVTKIASNEKIVANIKDRADTTLKTEIGSSHQDVSVTNLMKSISYDRKLKSTQDISPNASTVKYETSQVPGSPELKQETKTHKSDGTSDKNLTSAQHSNDSNNTSKPEEKTLCSQNLTKEVLAESKIYIPRRKPSGDADKICEQFPAATVEHTSVNHKSAQPDELVCEENGAITRKNGENLPLVNAEYVCKHHLSTSEHITIKPTEYSETQSESHYECLKLQEGSNMCDDHFSDISNPFNLQTYISTKASNGTQHAINNPSPSRTKYELAHYESTAPLRSILKSFRPSYDPLFKETKAYREDISEDANRSSITSIPASSISCPLSAKLLNFEFDTYKTSSTVEVGTKEQSFVQKFSTKSYFTDEENIVNFSDENRQTVSLQDKGINSISTCNYTQATISNSTGSCNLPKLPKGANYLCCPGELLNASKLNVPTFQHCPCMLNTYLKLLKTYYKSNKRPMLSETLVNF